MIRKWLPLIIFILSLSFCVLWLEAPSHLEQLKDDAYVGKTLLIYPTAGKFIVYDHWYPICACALLVRPDVLPLCAPQHVAFVPPLVRPLALTIR